jgi:hypothetical protein
VGIIGAVQLAIKVHDALIDDAIGSASSKTPDEEVSPIFMQLNDLGRLMGGADWYCFWHCHSLCHATMGVNGWFIMNGREGESFRGNVSELITYLIVTDDHKASLLACHCMLDAELLACHCMSLHAGC